MAALNFPSSPANGDVYQGYVYNAAKDVWTLVPQMLPNTIGNVADVDIDPAVANNHALLYNATSENWQSSAIPASAITSGTFDIGRIPTGITSSTVSLGNHTHTAGDLPNLESLNGTLDIANGGTGSTTASGFVIQTVSGSTSVTIATTTTTWTSFGLSLAFTPRFSTSKVLVLASGPRINPTSTTGYAACATIFRGISSGALTTNLAGTATLAHQPFVIAGPVGAMATLSTHIIDTPATTSTIYYTFAYRSEGSASNVYYDGPVKLTLMEIAA